MLDGSTHVLVLVVLMGFATIAVFAWAWLSGKLVDPEAQAASVLDARDLRLDRPWESAEERASREDRFGPLVAAEPGEWGDGRSR